MAVLSTAGLKDLSEFGIVALYDRYLASCAYAQSRYVQEGQTVQPLGRDLGFRSRGIEEPEIRRGRISAKTPARSRSCQSMIVLDTNLLIEYLDGVPSTMEWMDRMRRAGVRFAISVVTIVEVLAYAKLSPSKVAELDAWLAEFVAFDVDAAQARIAARLRRDHRLTALDGIIAALAVVLNVPFATHDVKLRRILGIKVIAP